MIDFFYNQQSHNYNTVKETQKSIKINNKMGNIQIRQTPKRTTSIFGRKSARSRSPFQQIVRPSSPYYHDYSPIKYDRSRTQKTELQSQPANQSFFKSPKITKYSQNSSERKNLIKETARKDIEPIELGNQNRQKCEQIIRKVRNFNDFLIQLKQRLEEDCATTLDSKKKTKGEVSMSVKLQNQRVELAKYKKLVERQLSKTHSIQHISIQNSASGQKILTIQYENLNPLKDKFQQNSGDNHSIIQNKTILKDSLNHRKQEKGTITYIQKKEEIATITHQPSISIRMDKIRQAQGLCELLKRKTALLASSLSEKCQLQDGHSLTDYLKVKQQAVNMNQLLVSLEQANRQSIQTQSKIRALLR